MSYSVRAKLAFGIDLGTTQPFFTDGRDGGVYAWAEGKAQKEIMEPVGYNISRSVILAVKGCTINAAIGDPAVNIDLGKLDLAVDDAKAETFKNHLLAAGLDEVEPRWLLVVDI